MELDYARLDPELAVILPALPAALEDIHRGNIADVRDMMDGQPAAAIETDVVISERRIAGPAGDLPLVTYRRPSKDVQPCLLWIHGGGYLFGTARDDRARAPAVPAHPSHGHNVRHHSSRAS